MSRSDVFLDRDGVIVRSRSDYVKSCAEVEFLPGAVEAIARLCRAGHRVMVVTNQSAVGRGILPWSDLIRIHRRLSAIVAGEGGYISHFLVCPHHPSDGCFCRKPKPGLLLKAGREMGSDLRSAFVVGDQVTDLQAAWAVGSHAMLVLSGETHTPPQVPGGRYLLGSDLSQAVETILSVSKEEECASVS